jgi:hypothetical protein
MTVRAVAKGTDRTGLDVPRKAFYSPREYAAIAGVHPSTVLDYIHSGVLYAVRISDRVYRIPLASLLRSLYPDEIAEPRFTTSGAAERAIAEERHRYDTEKLAKRRRPRTV